MVINKKNTGVFNKDSNFCLIVLCDFKSFHSNP